MHSLSRYDRMITGLITGIILPFFTALIIYAFVSHGATIPEYVTGIIKSGYMTHAITLCVVPCVILFFVFNRLDMLQAARGILTATIFWLFVILAWRIF